MRVKEVEYSRLFNLEDYNNERIGFRVAIDDNENADTVIGQLFFKVLQIEEALDLYRQYLKLISKKEGEISEYERRAKYHAEQLVDLENRKKELLEEEDSKVKMCQLLDLDEMIVKTKERLEELKEKRNTAISELKKLKKYKDYIAELIKTGEFEKVLSGDFLRDS